MKLILEIKDIHKAFKDLKVLRGISFTLQEGEVKVLLGPSGTGKSTLLRCINYLTSPDQGEVWLDGEEVTDSQANINRLRSYIGFVFQSFNLFPHLTALENVRIGPIKVRKIKKKEASELAMEKLDRVGLIDKANSYPAQLSGGQQQRVSIARALAMSPKVILFDEPTSALDPELIGEVLEVMRNLARFGMSMLVVTHEVGFARTVANGVLFLEGGQIIEEGSPDQFFTNPEHKRTKRFLQKITELYGEGETK